MFLPLHQIIVIMKADKLRESKNDSLASAYPEEFQFAIRWIDDVSKLSSPLLTLNTTVEINNYLKATVNQYNNLKIQLVFRFFAQEEKKINLSDPQLIFKNFYDGFIRNYDNELKESKELLLNSVNPIIKDEKKEVLQSGVDGAFLYSKSFLPKFIKTFMGSHQDISKDEIRKVTSIVPTIGLYSYVDFLLMALFLVAMKKIPWQTESIHLIVDMIDELMIEIEDTILEMNIDDFVAA